MLAPRKKLWSSPPQVAKAACDLLGLEPGDVLADFGCGDAVALVTAAGHVGCRAIGWEIDSPRAAAASARVAELGLSDLVKIHAGNALEADPTGITSVFLYLIERGLRMVLPLLGRIAAALPASTPLRVVTVLYRLPVPLVPTEIRHVQLSTDVRFPLFLYLLTSSQVEAAVAALSVGALGGNRGPGAEFSSTDSISHDGCS